MSKDETNPRPYVPSGFVMSHVVNPITLRLGGPTLTVAGRRSGRPISTPVPPFEYKSALYLVSGGGETQWVRNLRAAGEGELRIRYEISEIRYEQCSDTPFCLLIWPFLQPLRPPGDAGNVAEKSPRLQHPSGTESTEHANAAESAAGAGRAPPGRA